MNKPPLLNSRTRDNIERLISNSPHAVALTGEAGAGKGSAAHYLGAALLNIAQVKLINHPYFLCLDAKESKAGIDEVREMQSFLTLKVPGRQTVKRVVCLENID